jgi:hypothetical protein
MPACVRCGKSAKFRSEVCSDCLPAHRELAARVTPAARELLLNVGPFSPIWDAMLQDIGCNGFPARTGLAGVEKQALNWLSKFVAFVGADGIVTADERQTYHAAVQRLGLDLGKVKHLTASVERQFALSEIRSAAAAKTPRCEPTDRRALLLRRTGNQVEAHAGRRLLDFRTVDADQ